MKVFFWTAYSRLRQPPPARAPQAVPVLLAVLLSCSSAFFFPNGSSLADNINSKRLHDLWRGRETDPAVTLKSVESWIATLGPAPTHLRNELDSLKAQLLAKDGRFDEAQKLSSKLILLEPAHAPYEISHAHILFQRQLRKEALDHINRALVIDPNSAVGYMLRAEIAIRSGRAGDAIKDVKTCLRLGSPTDTQLYLRAANFYLAYGYLDDAQKVLDRWLPEHPELRHGWELLGQVQLRRHQYEKAADAFKQAALAENSSASYAIAACNLEPLKPDLALEYAHKAIRMNPGHSGAYHALGVILVSRQQNEMALSNFCKAIDIEPTLADYWISRADCHAILGHKLAALADSEQALKLKPNNPAYKLSCARYQYHLGHYSTVIELATQVIEAEPTQGEAYSLRARSLCQRGNYYDAVDDYTTANIVSPQDVQFLLARADAYLVLRLPTNALDDLNTILRRHPDYFLALELRTRLLRQLGYNALAEKDESHLQKLRAKEANKLKR